MNAQPDILERRTQPRFECHLPVYLEVDDTLLGYAKNLAVGGLLLVSEKSLPELEPVDLWFGADRDDKILNRIFATGYPVWQERNFKTGEHYYGIRFCGIDEYTIRKIEQVLEQLEQD